MRSEIETRSAVIQEARSWVGTPYHWHGRVKGPAGGVDCAMFIAEVFSRTGAIESPEIGHYSQQWHLHRDEEAYLAVIAKFAHRVRTPQPGDCAFFKFGRTYSHGAIVVAWPRVIHASIPDRCVLNARADQEPLRGGKPIFYSLWAEASSG